MNAVLETSGDSAPADTSAALAALADGMAKAAASVTDAELDAMFGTGFHLFSQNQHQRAGRIFALLAFYRPREPRYTEALALCCRKLKDYDHAIHLFARTLEVVPERLDLALQLVECLLLQGRKEAGCVMLAGIAQQARQDNNMKSFDRATAMLEMLTAQPA